MNQFGRALRPRGLEALAGMATAPAGNWWKDLLTLWRPSGAPAGDHGLRLAIRDGYMNFYRKGQSVARVGFDRAGRPVASVHVKYVYGDGETAQAYARLTEVGVERRDREGAAYAGLATLREWVRKAEGYSGEEKRLVDGLVEHNAGVIDLEMGLPAWGEVKTAPRMDLVVLERDGADLKIVFWEAKRVTDGRLRCRAELEPDRQPEVLAQLARYRTFLAEIGHPQQVVDAYREACALTCRLHDMAKAVGVTHELDAMVREAAAPNSALAVAGQARLVVFNGPDANQAAWRKHAAKLEQAAVSMVVLDAPGPLGGRLERAA